MNFNKDINDPSNKNSIPQSNTMIENYDYWD